MVQIDGTYTCVKGKEIVEQWIGLGYSEDELAKLIGSHWTMKVWVDGTAYGGHVICQEFPQYNYLEVFNEAVEKEVNHPLFGGKAKVTCTKTADGFKSVIKSEKFGEVISVEKYTDEGVNFTYTSGSHTSTETWARCVKIDGSYIFDKGENMSEYFKATGFPADDFMSSMKNYKIHACFKHSTLHTKEWFEGEIVENKMTLDVEGPMRFPDDKQGETPKRKALLTQSGVGKFTAFIKNPDGADEEWSYCFNDCGVVMCGLEKKTGQTCKIYAKRFTDIAGTYKIVSTIGFEKFAATMGVPAEMATQMMATAKTSITDLGNGLQRHQLTTGQFSMDITLKLNEEFSVFHPVLNENVKGIATLAGNTMTTVIKTSKGNMVTTMHVNDTFSVACIQLSGSGLWYKVIFEKVTN